MDVSVVICTRNRATSLHRCLASIRDAVIPPGLVWELVVVDNGSTDETAAVLAAFAPVLPLRILSEPEAGVSKARNRGLFAAEADYIVWTDDDVEVEAGWLTAYLDAFPRFPDAALFGGKITPTFEPPVPDWLAANSGVFFDAFAGRDFGDTVFRFGAADGKVPFGANFAFRTAIQRQFPFDPTVGAGTGMSGGEETKVIREIFAAGHYGVWVPGSAVKHHIPASRMSLDYIARFNHDTAYLLEREQPGSGRPLFGVPRWMLRDLAVRYARYRFSRLTRPVQDWVRDFAKYSFALGRVSYWRRRSQA